MKSLGSRLFVGLQYLLPKRLISRLIHRLTRIRWPWFKNAFIRVFCRLYDVDMSEAQQSDATAFESFNAFFTRELRAGVRPIAPEEDVIACPVDGTVSQAGEIDGDTLIQAKGRHYTLQALLGDESAANSYRGGSFATIYLAPYNYHRIHMPVTGTLTRMHYLPGQLFSVNEATVDRVDRLFARNERVVSEFATAIGPMAMVLVGALNVGSIETVWAGEVTPGAPRLNTSINYRHDGEDSVSILRGDEMGRFNMGSTVIVLLPPDNAQLDASLTPGRAVKLGQAIGQTMGGTTTGGAAVAT